MWLFDLLFCSLLQLWYFEVRISRSVSESPLEFEITRADCSLWLTLSLVLEGLNLVILFTDLSEKRSFRLDIVIKLYNSEKYLIYPNFSDKRVWANSADPGQTSDKGLHCLPLIQQF